MINIFLCLMIVSDVGCEGSFKTQKFIFTPERNRLGIDKINEELMERPKILIDPSYLDDIKKRIYGMGASSFCRIIVDQPIFCPRSTPIII